MLQGSAPDGRTGFEKIESETGCASPVYDKRNRVRSRTNLLMG
jgi:hypothetical protein